jgi:hypothetical protein
MNMITNGIFVANPIWILSHFVCSSFQRKNTKIKIERDNHLSEKPDSLLRVDGSSVENFEKKIIGVIPPMPPI